MNIDETSTSTGSGATSALNPAAQAIASDADSRTAEAVTTLGLVQQSRLSAQNRAVSSALAAYGKDSTQAASASQAVVVTKAASARLTVLRAKVTTAAPAVTSSGWALHGHVYDSALNPRESYTVFLVDGKKNYLNQYGFSYTDASGYYLINYDAGAHQPTSGAQAQPAETNPPSSNAPSDAPADAAASPAPDAQDRPSQAAAPSESAAPDLFLQVADASGNPVLLSQVSFTPVTGQAVYQDVTLAAGATRLGDPPADIRAVALPPAGA